MTSVSIDKFGKDHWSTFAYIETCCVDNAGKVDKSRMRTNENKHPLLASNVSIAFKWKKSNNTRLKGFFQLDGRDDPQKAIEAGLMIDGHDDWDCLDDLESHGLIEILSLANPMVQMTKLGLDASAKLRAHKASGGMFANFSYQSS